MGPPKPFADPAAIEPGKPTFLDLSRQASHRAAGLGEALQRILDSGVLIDGPELEAFEDEWATFTGRSSAVAVASGTDALRLVLGALQIGSGDEVIVPA